MRVLVAGAGGAMGRQLLPRLAAGDHEVVGMTRSAGKAELVQALGAKPVIADALDAEQVARAVAEAEPEAIVHELTALSGSLTCVTSTATSSSPTACGPRRPTTCSRPAARPAWGALSLRATRALARSGGPVKTEEDPLDPEPVASMRSTLEAIRHLEDAVTGADWTVGIVLRYGGFYGPGTSLAPGGENAEMIRRASSPWSGTARRLVLRPHCRRRRGHRGRLERGRPGIYNVVDDDPAPVREWLPARGSALGAKPPRHVPRWAGRLLAGEAAAMMMTEARGASNEKAKRDLGWQPHHPSWRQGFVEAAA